jgi:hypothetical protein
MGLLVLGAICCRDRVRPVPGHPCETSRRLSEAGVDAALRREAGLIHNFMLLDEGSPPALPSPGESRPTCAPACARPDAEAGHVLAGGVRAA